MTLVSGQLAGTRVFLTGHTGFTGSWLSLWLSEVGCQVTGYSLAPTTTPDLFTALGVKARLTGHHIGDIRDHHALKAAIAATNPAVVFHLAAQPLVRRSYADPLETVSINALGTASALEAARSVPSVRAFVCVTTDKVYENRGGPHRFSETDRLGGNDPYSASKACAEIISRCYQESMADLGNGMRIATARGGNIIGGGDWSDDRLVPDYFRALRSSMPLRLRYPDAIRPWQHVLSACHGYIAIANRLLSADAERDGSWNIGPDDAEPVTVRQLVTLLGEHSSPVDIEFERVPLHEATALLLDTSKAKSQLHFLPPWSTREAVKRTAEWYYRYYEDRTCAPAVSIDQLREYRSSIGDIPA